MSGAVHCDSVSPPDLRERNLVLMLQTGACQRSGVAGTAAHDSAATYGRPGTVQYMFAKLPTCYLHANSCHT